jgi:hypothetical protein
MEIKKYAAYIIECKKRGFDDYTIKNSLLMKGWPENDIVRAFYYVEEQERKEENKTHEKQYPQQSFGSSVTIFLDGELREALEKRAKKNMLMLPEQIEDILRRSTLNLKGKKSLPDEKLDDKLVGVFSRRNTGQKTKKKKAQKSRKKAKKEQRLKKKVEKKEKRKAKKRR